MKAFLTGSQVYGTPTESSDIDLCVLMEYEQECMLKKLLLQDEMEGTSNGVSYRFGRLNVLVFQDAKAFQSWHDATEYLKSIKPVDRATAIKTIEQFMQRKEV